MTCFWGTLSPVFQNVPEIGGLTQVLGRLCVAWGPLTQLVNVRLLERPTGSFNEIENTCPAPHHGTFENSHLMFCVIEGYSEVGVNV